MEIIYDKTVLRETLQSIEVKRVAVAYLGAGWGGYINVNKLEEIVISPTVGSNPLAIAELADAIGWDRIHFLDRLHSKIYLGEIDALIGSANLSGNGMEEGGKYEVMVKVEGGSSDRRLNDLFREYVTKSKALYATEEEKIKKLDDLLSVTNRGYWDRVINTPTTKNKIGDVSEYQLGHIYLSCYQPDKVKFNMKSIKAETGVKTVEEVEDYLDDYLSFHEEDKINEGDWILYWNCNEDGFPRKNGRIDWLQVQKVIPHGFDDDYSKLVAEITGLKKPPVPFELTGNIKDKIRMMLGSKKYPELLALDEELWKLNPSKKTAIKFLKDLKIAQQEH